MAGKRPYQLGRNPHPRRTRQVYPWHQLKKSGDCFTWLDRSRWQSLRVQVAVRKRLYGITYSVNLVPKGVMVTRL